MMKGIIGATSVFYASYLAIPFLMLLVTLALALPQFHYLVAPLEALLGLCLLAYGLIGFKEVFLHG